MRCATVPAENGQVAHDTTRLWHHHPQHPLQRPRHACGRDPPAAGGAWCTAPQARRPPPVPPTRCRNAQPNRIHPAGAVRHSPRVRLRARAATMVGGWANRGRLAAVP